MVTILYTHNDPDALRFGVAATRPTPASGRLAGCPYDGSSPPRWGGGPGVWGPLRHAGQREQPVADACKRPGPNAYQAWLVQPAKHHARCGRTCCAPLPSGITYCELLCPLL